jgi:hypothetical protein
MSMEVINLYLGYTNLSHQIGWWIILIMNKVFIPYKN